MKNRHMEALLYTPTEVAKWMGIKAVEAARSHAYSIIDVRWDGHFLNAEVNCSPQPPRHVRVFFDMIGDKIADVRGACSCKLQNCEHAAAVLLAESRPDDFIAEAVEPGIGAHLESWLDAFRRRTQPVGPVPKSRHGPIKKEPTLVYILCLNPSGAPEIALHWARVTTTGEIEEICHFNSWDTRNFMASEAMTASDREIVDLLRSWGQEESWELTFVVQSRRSAEIFNLLVVTGRFYWTGSTEIYRDTSCHLLNAGAPRSGIIRWQPEHLTYRPALQTEPESPVILYLDPPWYFDRITGEAGPIVLIVPWGHIQHILEAPPVSEADAHLLHAMLRDISPDLPIAPIGDSRNEIETIDAVPSAHLTLDTINVHQVDFGEDRYEKQLDIAVVRFVYGSVSVSKDTPPLTSIFRKADGSLVRVNRDHQAEKALLARLNVYGFRPIGRDAVSPKNRLPMTAMGITIKDRWSDFYRRGVPELRDDGWTVTVSRNFRHNIVRIDSIDGIVRAGAEGWLDIEMGIKVGGHTIRLEPLLADVFANDRRWLNGRLEEIGDDETVEVRASDGQRLHIPAARIKPVVRNLVDLLQAFPGSRLHVSTLDAHRLLALEDTLGWEFQGADAVRAMARRLLDGPGVVDVPLPQGLKGVLRPYQHAGYNWLQFLREANLAGILADDMGLGKTVQTLAHILAEKEAGRLDKPALVVVPKTLVSNWKAEAADFTPDLTVLTLDGPDRKGKFDAIGNHDLVVTTYALLPRDEEQLCQQDYHLLILDEAQYVRNPTTKAAHAIRRFSARHRLCITGTPIENHLLDLWAQFDFLLPSFLGNRQFFTKAFRTPIEREESDAVRAALLRDRVRPFILRRKKEEVEKELPEKVLIVRTVELEGPQRDLYETVRAAQDEKVRSAIATIGLAKSGIIVLDALLKLREVCCDPRLVKLPAGVEVAESAKLTLLMDLITQLVSEGRKILVVSFFPSMLALIAQKLDEEKFGYVQLTGKTRDRETPINRFQNGEMPIFLISLKTGGVGLNLTAADVVIHYDPWWNPHAEEQATARAHRIGSKAKTLFVYKLLVAGSIEEKIVALQHKKAALANSIVEHDTAGGVKFTLAAIEALLAPLPVLSS